MTTQEVTCKTCGNISLAYKCNACGIDVRGMDDAVQVRIVLVGHNGPAGFEDYCAPCARKKYPEGMGVAP